jgi:hypothetical protein
LDTDSFSVQVLPDRYLISEAFNWRNKEVIFEVLAKNQKSGVIFLSGDVHFAQFYSSNCALENGYVYHEFTSSGLSHTQDNFQFGTHLDLSLLQNPFWTSSDLSLSINFGQLEISEDKISLSAHDLNRNTLLRKVLQKSELQYRHNLKAAFCRLVHSKHKKIFAFNNYLAHTLELKNPMIMMYLVFYPYWLLCSLSPW